VTIDAPAAHVAGAQLNALYRLTAQSHNAETAHLDKPHPVSS
jgi:hypothetical protein